MNKKQIARFWSKVEKTDGCWLWMGARRPEGYGKLSIKSRGIVTWYRAHRVSWELTFGPLPPAACVLHRCDRPSCVRPDHLFLGSRADNVADCLAKGRTARGPMIRNAKLTDDQVRAIRRRAAAGTLQYQLAAEYGVTTGRISAIVLRQSWKHL